LKNRINKSIKSGASSWFSARNICKMHGQQNVKFSMKCVYCAVRSGSVDIIQVTPSFKVLTILYLLCS
jgi:hypothetical protein